MTTQPETMSPAERKTALVEAAKERMQNCIGAGYSRDEARRNAIAFIAGAAYADKVFAQVLMRAIMDGIDGLDA